MDNTGNPIPQLSSLTLRLDADNETVACRVRLSLGQISVAINPKSEFLVSWGNATLSIDHAGCTSPGFVDGYGLADSSVSRRLLS